MSALFYVGAYSEALVAAELDTERGEMREVYRADGAHRATVLALNQARTHLYAGHEYFPGSGGVSAWKLDDAGCPRQLNYLPAHGEGPCHVALVDGAHVYAVCELNSTMAALRFDRAAGVLEAMQIRSTLPEGYTGFSEAVDVCIPRGGRHLYTLNRGQDSIAVFPLLASGAPLGAPSHVAEGVKLPRSLAADPSGQFLLVCNEHADEVALYSLCPEDGLPVFTGVVLPAEKPAGICFYEGDL